MPYQRNGVKPSRFDSRDYLVEVQPTGDIPSGSPVTVNGSVWNQRNVPCCAAIAVASCMEIQLARQGEAETLSPLFLYYFTRLARREATNGPRRKDQLVTLEMREVLKTAAKKGVCRLHLHDKPFTRKGALAEPSPEAVEDAVQNRISQNVVIGASEYRSLPNPSDHEHWRLTLSQGHALACVFPISRAYRALGNGASTHGAVRGIVADPNFHTVTAVGYDDNAAVFRVRDSRGLGFCDHGHWYLPYDVVATPRFIEEVWTIQSVD